MLFSPFFLSFFFAAEQSAFDINPVLNVVGSLIYALLALVAFWGAYSLMLIWRKVAQLRFRNENEQDQFLNGVEELVRKKEYTTIVEHCADDSRALARLTHLACNNARLSLARLRELLVERYQRDVTAELDYRGAWVQTIIKAAPMLGLFGTVVGMMGAFSKLSATTQVSPDKLAADISVALITTACGLSIAIPLILATASVNNQISKLEDLTGTGLRRLLDIFKGQE